MDRPRRTHAEARAWMRDGIIRLGNEQLAEVGAAALSVREIARGLGVASSAIYRHVASRDELLTLLIVDAYTDLADTALAASDAAGSEGVDRPGERIAALARGMRTWAVAHPERWALAYGSPVPGYAAPSEETTGPGTRVMAVFMAILAEGTVDPHDAFPVSPGLARELALGAAAFGIEAESWFAVSALEAWASLVGIISAEVFGQLGAGLSPYGAELVERWIAGAVSRFGLDAGSPPASAQRR